MVAQKRKGPCNTSSFWNILPPRKVSVREQVQQRPCSPLSEVQAPETDIRFDYLAIKHPKNTPFAIIQRSGSKVLTVLGILSGSRSYAQSSLAGQVEIGIDKGEVEEAPARFQTSKVEKTYSSTRTPTSERVVTPVITDIITPKASQKSSLAMENAIEGRASELALVEKTARITSLDIHLGGQSYRGLRKSRSMPGLAHSLSHKFSSTFGHPTIIHRPKLRVRLTFSSGLEDLLQTPNTPSIYASPVQHETKESGFMNSRSMSLGGLSTTRTSFETSYGTMRTNPQSSTDKTITPALTVIEELDDDQKPLVDHTRAVSTTPTIRTVETTTNAKIFFETHFNTILSDQSTARESRRQDLEARLWAERLSPEQRYQERLSWAGKETEHLRQLRVMKSRKYQMVSEKGISVAGYEVIRVLGKGSFGVVRLVREKRNGSGELEQSADCIRKIDYSAKTMALPYLRYRSDGRRAFNLKRSQKSTRDVYAMKVIRKSEMLRSSQEGHLRAERDFLVASEKSRWVVPLIASFQDNNNLYLVMEFMIGGDFLGYLIKHDRLDEGKTRFYIAEMILCLEEAHRLKWIHRDVKPDNFLISSSGHLKISDFGLAFDGHWAHDQSYYSHHRYSLLEKLGISVEGDARDQDEMTRAAGGPVCPYISAKEFKAKQRHQMPSEGTDEKGECLLQWRNRHGRRAFARSVVGTTQYMAPEVVRGLEYDGRCDWWSVGVIMYECLYGETPFLGEDRQETKGNILDHKETLRFIPSGILEWKYKVSPQAINLIMRLLTEKEHRLCSRKYIQNDYYRAKRLGTRTSPSLENAVFQDAKGYFVYPNDAEDIKVHPFFHGIDWQNLHLMTPPEIPNVKNRLDTKYFDQEGPISDIGSRSTTSSIQEEELLAQEELEKEIVEKYQQEMNVESAGNNRATQQGPEKKHGVKYRERRRPRDRILRDRSIAKEVLELRKQGAFAGYAYRRPHAILSGIENTMIRRKWE